MQFNIRDLLLLMFLVAVLADAHRLERARVDQDYKLAVYEATLTQLNENQRIMDSWMRNWKIKP